MRKKVARIVSVCILVVITIISVCKVSDLLQRKESDNRYASFFAEKNSIDVIFLGSSHVRNGIFPMELWNDYGITSYNLAGNGNTIPVSYGILVNALDYQMPKVVVMDVFDMWPGRKISTLWGHVHASFNAFPLSMNKYKTVMDLIDDKNMTDGDGNPVYDKRWDLLFDLGEYHTRWSSLGEGDFDNQSKLESNSAVWKGANPAFAIVERNEHTYAEHDDLYYDDIAKDYLVRMIQLCQSNNINLLLINTGYDCSDEAKYFADSVNQIAKQYNLPYIDFTELDIINFESDLRSSGYNTHVNFSGAEKITSYIGQCLTEQYQLSDHRNDEKYDSWWCDYQSFVNSKADYLRQQNSLDLYLMLLADDNYHMIIEILDTGIIGEENNTHMFGNLGIDIDQLSDQNNLVVVDMSEKEISYLSNNYESGSKWMSVLGEISLWSENEQQGDTDGVGVYLDSKKIYVASSDESARIRIAVINRNSGEVVDVHVF